MDRAALTEALRDAEHLVAKLRRALTEATEDHQWAEYRLLEFCREERIPVLETHDGSFVRESGAARLLDVSPFTLGNRRHALDPRFPFRRIQNSVHARFLRLLRQSNALHRQGW